MSTTEGPIVPVLIGSSTDFPSTVRVAEVGVGDSTDLSLMVRVAEAGVIVRLPWAHLRSCTAVSILQRITRNKSNQRSRIRKEQNPQSLLRILVTERLAVFVIGEELAIAAEIDDRPERPLGVVLAHVVFELFAEADGGRAMGRPLVKNPLDV